MIILEELEELERELGYDAGPLRERVSQQRVRAARHRGGKRLGEILVEEGHLDPQDLERVLEEQRAVPEIPLGKLLVRHGHVSAFKVYKALGKQYGIDPTTCADVHPIGEQLVSEGIITEEQLQEALKLQSEGPERKMLGRILVQLGYADLHQIYQALCHQLGRILYHLANETTSRKALAEHLHIHHSEDPMG